MDSYSTAPGYGMTLDENRIAVICRELPGREKSPLYAREVIRRFFEDPSIDLFTLFPPNINYPEHPYFLAYNALNANSIFFETVIESEDILSQELWTSIAHIADRTFVHPNETVDSLLMRLIAEWTTRLLPVEATPPSGDAPLPPPQRTISTSSHHGAHRIHTPLELFLPDSPLLTRMNMDSSAPIQSYGKAIHPKFISMIAQLMITLCSTNQFPSVTRLIILRYLCKQFHIFCLVTVPETEIMAVKSAIHNRPPFSTQIYAFLHSTIDVCPSVNIFKDIVDVWLTFTRPWRYDDSFAPSEVTVTPYVQFVRNHDKFYSVLLGKILRRMRELDVGKESVRHIRCVLESCWRTPSVDIFRLLGVDPRPPCELLVAKLRDVRDANKLIVEEQTKKCLNSSWWEQLTSNGEDERVRAARETADSMTEILNEVEHNMGIPAGGYGRVETPCPDSTVMSTLATTSALYTTPRSRSYALPDHEKDARTGVMHLTPEGRRQVISRERSFDFSPCHRMLPPVLSNVTMGECAWLSSQLSRLSLYLAQMGPVKVLADSYKAKGALGYLSRFVLEPPYPDPSRVSAPYFRSSLPVTPPLLNLRFLARYTTLVCLFVLSLAFLVSPWYLMLFPVIGVIGLTVVLAADES